VKDHKFPPRRILVPSDLSAASSVALAFARVLQDRFEASVHVLHAQHFDLPPYFSSGQMDNLTHELKKSKKAATDYLRREATAALGRTPEVSIVDRPPAEAILEAATRLVADLLIMGTHGRRGAERIWLGSVAERVLRESPSPVLAVRQTARPGLFRSILCPVNFTDVAQEALDYALKIAAATQAQLTVLHALEEGKPVRTLPLIKDQLRQHCDVEEVVVQGSAAKTILEAARNRKPDLIVIGAERKVSHFGGFFSSTTERVMQWAEAPLLVVPKEPLQQPGSDAGVPRKP